MQMARGQVAGGPVVGVRATTSHPRVVLTAEHAGGDLPPPWSWPAADRWLVGTHWATDVGVVRLTHALAAAEGAPAVLSTFSRLLVDPNRPTSSDTLFRDRAEGRAVVLNTGLGPAERKLRLDTLYAPYHDAVDAMVAASPGALVLSLHTFTPSYEGTPRAVQLGVLYDTDEPAALRFYEAVRGHGLDTRLNEPWSGREGLMHSPALHARHHGRVALELEVRNDLADDPAWTARLVALIQRGLDAVLGAPPAPTAREPR